MQLATAASRIEQANGVAKGISCHWHWMAILAVSYGSLICCGNGFLRRSTATASSMLRKKIQKYFQAKSVLFASHLHCTYVAAPATIA